MDDKYILAVSEPWEFKNSNGGTRLEGEVIRVIDEKHIIFKSQEEVCLHGVRGRLFLLCARYCGYPLVHDGVIDETAGGGLIMTDDYMTADWETIEKNSVYVIIGHIGKAKE